MVRTAYTFVFLLFCEMGSFFLDHLRFSFQLQCMQTFAIDAIFLTFIVLMQEQHLL